jgi:hypothetical protein
MDASINLLAKLKITATATSIHIEAKEEVVINGGGSYTVFNSSGIEDGTSGSWAAHAGSHSMNGPKSAAVPTLKGMPRVPDKANFSQRIDPTALVNAEWLFEDTPPIDMLSSYEETELLARFGNQGPQAKTYLFAAQTKELNIHQSSGGWMVEMKFINEDETNQGGLA